jgi:hypothetical protein
MDLLCQVIFILRVVFSSYTGRRAAELALISRVLRESFMNAMVWLGLMEDMVEVLRNYRHARGRRSLDYRELDCG